MLVLTSNSLKEEKFVDFTKSVRNIGVISWLRRPKTLVWLPTKQICGVLKGSFDLTEIEFTNFQLIGRIMGDWRWFRLIRDSIHQNSYFWDSAASNHNCENTKNCHLPARMGQGHGYRTVNMAERPNDAPACESSDALISCRSLSRDLWTSCARIQIHGIESIHFLEFSCISRNFTIYVV